MTLNSTFDDFPSGSLFQEKLEEATAREAEAVNELSQATEVHELARQILAQDQVECATLNSRFQESMVSEDDSVDDLVELGEKLREAKDVLAAAERIYAASGERVKAAERALATARRDKQVAEELVEELV